MDIGSGALADFFSLIPGVNGPFLAKTFAPSCPGSYYYNLPVIKLVQLRILAALKRAVFTND